MTAQSRACDIDLAEETYLATVFSEPGQERSFQRQMVERGMRSCAEEQHVPAATARVPPRRPTPTPELRQAWEQHGVSVADIAPAPATMGAWQEVSVVDSRSPQRPP